VPLLRDYVSLASIERGLKLAKVREADALKLLEELCP